MTPVKKGGKNENGGVADQFLVKKIHFAAFVG